MGAPDDAPPTYAPPTSTEAPPTSHDAPPTLTPLVDQSASPDDGSLQPITTMQTPPPTPSLIGFRYVWTVRVNERKLTADEQVILHVSPKIATVHDHVSFQWNLRIHGMSGQLTSDDEDDKPSTGDEEEDGPTPISYVAVELYFVDGPVDKVDVKAVVGIVQKATSEDDDSALHSSRTIVEERKSLKMQRGRGCELTDTDRAEVSDYIKNNVGRQIRFAVTIKMDAKLFDPYTYLNQAPSPTPNESFLTANYNARVNSKVWKRRSRKNTVKGSEGRISRKQKIDYEERFRRVLAEEEEMAAAAAAAMSASTASTSGTLERLRVADRVSRRGSVCTRRGSTDDLSELRADHEHLFKKLLIACCDGCERRRRSSIGSCDHSRVEDIDDEHSDEEGDDEPESFECTEEDKEHVHDLLANMYFNEVCVPHMEYIEDFVDLLIDAELNDLPVLKRACERYLCGELNTKKELATSLLLDLLFISIVFSLNVMKSMTLSELSARVDELRDPEQLLEDDEFKKIDKRIRSLSDRNLVELIEQCVAFAEQRARVQTLC